MQMCGSAFECPALTHASLFGVSLENKCSPKVISWALVLVLLLAGGDLLVLHVGWCELGRLEAQIYNAYGDFSVSVKRETMENW